MSVIILKYYGIRKKDCMTVFETRADVAKLAAISVLSCVLCEQTHLLCAISPSLSVLSLARHSFKTFSVSKTS